VLERDGAPLRRERARDRVDGTFGVVAIDVEMRHRAKHAGPGGEGEKHAFCAEPGDRLVGVEAEHADVDEHEVRLDLLEIDRQPRVDQPVRQATIPAWRIAPPKRCLKRRAFCMRSREPATRAPSGQPSPFDRQIETVSASRP
jgi:hypothetical protein